MMYLISTFLIVAFVLQPTAASSQRLGFEPGESVKTFLADMKAKHLKPSLDGDGFISLPNVSVTIANITSSEVSFQTENNRVTSEVLSIDHTTFDTCYSRLSTNFGAPIEVEYGMHDSLTSVTFRDSAVDYTLQGDCDEAPLSLVITAHDPSKPNLGEPRWKLLLATGSLSFYVDTTLNFEHWITILEIPSPEMKDVLANANDRMHPGLGYKAYKYSLVTFQVDCELQRYIKRNQADFGEKNRFIRYHNVDDTWTRPDTDDLGDYLLTYLCGEEPTKG